MVVLRHEVQCPARPIPGGRQVAEDLGEVGPGEGDYSRRGPELLFVRHDHPGRRGARRLPGSGGS
ncbi:MAG: hypothetical protein ACRD03_01410, partial [Acidimicrobiales bacterium]